MSFKPMLLPLLAQVLLTFTVWFYLFARRIPEILGGNIDPQRLKDRAEGHLVGNLSGGQSFLEAQSQQPSFFLRQSASQRFEHRELSALFVVFEQAVGRPCGVVPSDLDFRPVEVLE